MDEQSYLYYNDEENMFYDECGFPVFNIFSIISPNTLRLFIEYGEDMLAYTIDGGCVGLIWEKPTSDNHHENITSEEFPSKCYTCTSTCRQR